MGKGFTLASKATRCPHCKFFTRNKLLLARHRKTCPRNVDKQRDLNERKQKQNEAASFTGHSSDSPEQFFRRKYQCTDCDNFSTMKSKEYLEHRIHIHGEKIQIHQCNQCQYCSRYRFLVMRHMNIHTNADENDDEVELTPQSNAAEKTPGKKKFSWKIKALNKAPLSMLKRKQDAAEMSIMSVNAGELFTENYQCKFCDFKTTKKIEFFAHKAGHVKTSDAPDDGKSSALHKGQMRKTSKRTFHKCAECDFMSPSRPSFAKHLMSHSINGQYKCPKCSYSSSVYPTITRHIAFHHLDDVDSSYGVGLGADDDSAYEHDPDVVIEAEDDDDDDDDDSSNGCSDKVNDEIAEDAGVDRGAETKVKKPERVEEEAIDGVYTCNECGEDYDSSDLLRLHKISHQRNKSLACIVCDVECVRVADFSRHLILRHSINMGYEVYGQLQESLQLEAKNEPLDLSVVKDPDIAIQCGLCPFETEDVEVYTKHAATHTAQQRFACTTCPKTYKYKSDLKVHIRREHPGETAKMDAATQDTERLESESVNDYMIDKKDEDLSLLKQKRFRCTLCSYMSWRKEDTKRHIYNKHPNYLKTDRAPSPSATESMDYMPVSDGSCSIQVYRCDLCNFFTSSHSYLTSHRRGHDSYKRWRCPQCGHRSNWKSDVFKHMRKKHPACEQEVDKMDLAEARDTLKDYMERYPERRFKNNRASVAENKVQLMYKCSLCTCMSMLRTSVSKHIRKKHAGEDVSILVTELGQANSGEVTTEDACLTSTPKAEALSNHRAEELAGSFRYACGDCSKRCVHAWGVKRHYAYCHPGEKPRIIDTHAGNKEVKDDSDDLPASPSMPELVLADDTQDTSQLNASLESVDRSETSSSSPAKEFMGKVAKMTRVRPFKCSICQRRSNWKWDMKKHLRTVHPGVKGHVITLTTEEAMKEPIVNVPLLRPTARVPKNLKFQCSACGKRSAYSGDIRKHIVSKHPDLTVVVLNLDKCETKDAQTGEETNERGDNVADTSASNRTLADHTEVDTIGDLSERIQTKGCARYAWTCTKCTFTHRSRHVMMDHLGVHDMKAYCCKLCNCSASYRSALYRHLRSTHACTDYSMCAELMQYKRLGDEPRTQNTAAEDVMYYCRVCSYETKSQTVVRRHLREKHQLTNPVYCGSRMLGGDAHLLRPEEVAKPPKRHACNMCPYTTNKLNLLKIHRMNHKPHPGKPYKCKYCSYYVSLPRLVQQHMLLHVDGDRNKIASVSSAKLAQNKRRHSCDKCPYSTNSKNDYLFHKQFHRPRPNANFKCDQCDYWVTLKRLLTQHMKLHSSAAVNTSQNDSQNSASPCKSDVNDMLLNLSPIEITELKQKIITSKILSSTNGESSERVSDYMPKLHKCRHCPYNHFRARNVRFHERMHGWRQTGKPLYKCPSCDYYVGSKGLLSHHMKVHMQNNGATDGIDVTNAREVVKSDVKEQDELLEVIKFKRYACEKCPFATSKRSQFLRHSELHASKQRYVCKFCDYSVPTNVLLIQHEKIHMSPNYNLLSIQSVANLQHLPVVTAKTAVNATLSATTGKTSDLIHDDRELYENIAPDTDSDARKLYRCDQCPYTNSRRDYLLSHLKFHMFASDLKCDHCTYSVAKPHLLAQHLKVHFAPLPEFTDWLNASGFRGREVGASADVQERDSGKPIDDADTHAVMKNSTGDRVDTGGLSRGIKAVEQPVFAPRTVEANGRMTDGGDDKEKGHSGRSTTEPEKSRVMKKDGSGEGERTGRDREEGSTESTCQYCDRKFDSAQLLLQHEMQHLIGSNPQTESLKSQLLVQ